MKSNVLLTVKETCKILQMSPNRLRQLIKEKKIKTVRFGKNSSKFLIPSSHLEKVLKDSCKKQITREK